MARTYAEECSYLEKLSDCSYRIKKGFVPNMNVSACQRSIATCIIMLSARIVYQRSKVNTHTQVEGLFYVNDNLKNLMYDELKHHSASQGSVCKRLHCLSTVCTTPLVA